MPSLPGDELVAAANCHQDDCLTASGAISEVSVPGVQGSRSGLRPDLVRACKGVQGG